MKSEHIVLDMCSSPGSKTKQVAEMMLRDANGDAPQGLLVSNEMDAARCDRLTTNLIRYLTIGLHKLRLSGVKTSNLNLDFGFDSQLRYPDRYPV